LFLTKDKLPKVFFHDNQKRLLVRHDRWRRTTDVLKLTKEAKSRLEWIIFYETKGEKNARLTARHFGIVPKTFYQWYNRFDENDLRTLEERSRAPLNRRKREYTPLQYVRVVKLRKKHIRWGKLKILKLYQDDFPKDKTMTGWKVQCIIEVSGLYYHPAKQARINRKRVLSVKRKKITDLTKKPVTGFLVCIDTVVRYVNGQKRYILTAIDRYSKLGFARMYTTHSSKNAEDFLYRLHYLLDGKIKNVQTDNGSEFKLHFDNALTKLNIPHYHSRVKTPKDNAVNERFNRTIEEEFIVMGNLVADTNLFNQRLTEWLVEYNFKRPHQTLGYLPPINFHFKYHKVLPMYPSNTT
jgi:transposase InsO family protein